MTERYSLSPKEKRHVILSVFLLVCFSWTIFDHTHSDDDEENEKTDSSEKPIVPSTNTKSSSMTRCHSVPTWKLTVAKVDKVYSVGCFDLFHDGHKILLQRLSALGRQVCSQI